MKNKWNGFNNLFYVPNLKGKWYRHLNILAAIFIFIGGVGLNTYHTLPRVFYIVTLAIGAVIFGIFLILIQRNQLEDNSKY
jgi:NhaP-type Na+/H+ or K+/H+ antiporter